VLGDSAAEAAAITRVHSQQSELNAFMAAIVSS
jgi:hypothetical protein